MRSQVLADGFVIVSAFVMVRTPNDGEENQIQVSQMLRFFQPEENSSERGDFVQPNSVWLGKVEMTQGSTGNCASSNYEVRKILTR